MEMLKKEWEMPGNPEERTNYVYILYIVSITCQFHGHSWTVNSK